MWLLLGQMYRFDTFCFVVMKTDVNLWKNRKSCEDEHNKQVSSQLFCALPSFPQLDL